MNIVLGKSGHKNLSVEIDTLLVTRMLIQADSGGGKTWLMRVLAEQFFGKVQVIIIDPEGEFATLREKYGYVLVGKGGETPADTRSAALLAHRLLELKASAVCDIYEMKSQQRHTWVRLFLEAMIDAPKNLWHPCVVIVDEAHIFCPEKGKGESEASQSMIDLCTRGRKRGYCAIFATQRLSVLNKDASGMLLNRLIGPTFESGNVERAIKELNVAKDEVEQFRTEIKTLDPGHFYAFGRAVSKERVLFTVGHVQTTHAEVGSKHSLEPPPPPDNIAKLLPKLSDLPKAAEEKAKTEAELRKELRDLKTQLRNQPTVPVEVKVVDQKAIARAVLPFAALLEEAVKVIVKINAIGFDDETLKSEHMNTVLREIGKQVQRLVETSNATRAAEFDKLKKEASKLLARVQKTLGDQQVTVDLAVKRFAVEGKVSAGEIQKEKATTSSMASSSVHHPRPDVPYENNGDLSKPQLAILKAIAEFEAIGRTQISKSWIAARSGASYTSSTFTNNLGYLRSNGFLTYPVPDTAALTDKGRSAAGPVNVPTSSGEMLQSCLALLSTPQQKILQVLYGAHPKSVDKAALAEETGASATSSTFTNNLGALRSAGMIEYPEKGTAKAAAWIFVE